MAVSAPRTDTWTPGRGGGIGGTFSLASGAGRAIGFSSGEHTGFLHSMRRNGAVFRVNCSLMDDEGEVKEQEGGRTVCYSFCSRLNLRRDCLFSHEIVIP